MTSSSGTSSNSDHGTAVTAIAIMNPTGANATSIL